MAFNVVYSDKDRIQGAIESGVIPRESLVLTSDDAKRCRHIPFNQRWRK